MEHKQVRHLALVLGFSLLVALLGTAIMPTISPNALAATPIYVRPNGDDTYCDGTVDVDYPGSGGPGLPCAVQTIQKGIDLVDPAGTVNVAAGTYSGPINIDGRSGITVNGADKTTVLLQPTSVLDWNACGHTTARKAALRVVNSTGVVVQNMTIDMNLVKANFVLGFLFCNSTGTVNNNVLKNLALPDASGGYYEIGGDFTAPGFSDASRAAITISNNEFIDTGRLGVVTHWYVDATITGNTFYKTSDDFGYAIEFGGPSTGEISNNTIYGFDTPALSDGSESAGIYVENAFTNALIGITKDVLVQGNEVYDSQYGLWIGNGYDGFAGDVDIAITLNDNYIHDNEGGVWIQDEDKAAGSSVTVAGGGNTLVNNGANGYYIYTEGDGDITLNLSEEKINGHGVGVYVADGAVGPSGSSYAVSVAGSDLSGNTTYAFQNTVASSTANGSGNWWGSNVAASVAAEIAGSVDYTPWLDIGTDTSLDPGFQGDFATLWVDDDSPQTGAVGRVQEGVNLVTASTVNIVNGTYEEAVVIDNKTVTLKGESLSAIVKAPVTIPTCTTTSYDWHPVVCAKNGSTATIDTLTIDGAGRGNGNYRFMGVAFRNAGGAVKNSLIKDIRDTPFSGAQHGVGIFSYNDDSTPRAIAVLDNTISGFQKNGMALNSADNTVLTVDVQRNAVTGAGTTSTTAQNGIQTYGDLISGTMADNTVTGIAYGGTSWVASTILNFYSDLTISGNTVSGAQVGIYNVDGQSQITGNNIDIIDAGDYSWGIVASDPPDLHPSPFGVEDMTGTGGVGADSPTAVLNLNVSNNTVDFDGASNTSRFGIEADAGYGPDDIALTANGNTVTDFEVGIEIYKCQTGCSAGVFTAVTAHNNCLSGNTYGMRSNVSTLLANGESNWWGAASGPYHATQNPSGTGDDVSDYVDFTPWLTACTGGSPTGNFKNVTQNTFHATLQEATNSASPGDVIQPVGSGPFGPEGTATVTTPGVTINLNGATFGPGSPWLTVSAANVTVNGPGTLDGNGSLDPAIRIVTGGDNFILNGVEVREWADGVEVANSVTSFKLVNNWIHSNTDAGMQVNSGVSLGGVVTIQGNLFKVNGGKGVQNDGATTNLNVEYNSWGDVGGPTATLGDGVGGSVDYTPWTFAETYIDVDPTTSLDQYQRNVDESTSFDVNLNVEAANLYGLAFQFTYDPNYLTFNGPPTFSAPWSGSCFVVGAPPAGTFKYQCYLTSGPAWNGGTVATFNFTANGVALTGDGPWTTYFDISHLETNTSAGAVGGVKVFVNNAGYNAPTTTDRDITDTNDGRIDITGIAQFTGFVDLQGRPNDSGAVMSVFSGPSKPGTAIAAATSASSGAYTTAYIGANLLTVGTTYYLYFDRALYLPTTADAASVYAHSKLLSTRPTTPVNTFVLLGGDATDDNVVDINDGTCIGNQYSLPAAPCGVGGLSSSDVTGDGTTNILDLVLFGGNYGLSASPWTP